MNPHNHTPPPSLIDLGFTTPDTTESLRHYVSEHTTVLALIDDSCTCIAGAARRAVAMGLHDSAKEPHGRVAAVAGENDQVIAQLWDMAKPYPRTVPAIILIKERIPVLYIERHQIKSLPARELAAMIKEALEKHGKDK